MRLLRTIRSFFLTMREQVEHRGSLNRSVLFYLLICSSLFIFQIVPAFAVFIDFETYLDGTATSAMDQVDTQFFSWGISVISSLQYNSSTGDFDIVPAIIRQDLLTNPYASGVRALAPAVGDGTYYGPAQAPIELDFSTPLNYFSVYAMDVGWNGLIAEAYDANSFLLSSVTIDGTGREHYGEPGGDGLDFIEFFDAGISKIVFYQIHDAQWDSANGLGTEGYLLDSVTFTTYYAFNLPDTGQTQSYSAGFGEDSDYNINQPEYDISPDNLTVLDYNTGIVWQREDDGITRTWSQAADYCENLNLSGYSDWRLPAKKELMSIVDYGTYGPAIDSTSFPYTQFDPVSNSKFYWSSTVYDERTVPLSPKAFAVSFYNGNIDLINKTQGHYVRCMRVNSYPPPIFIDNGDGTVLDNSTGLTWQQGENAVKNWSSALSYCEGLSLANHDDWRLPNIKELESIVDDAHHNPAIDLNYFPDVSVSQPQAFYWSSTTFDDGVNSDTAFFVYIVDGRVFQLPNHPKSTQKSVRCVRGPDIPQTTTTMGDGADPAGATVAPGSAGNLIDVFTLVTDNAGGATVDTLTVTTANTSAVASVEIWDSAFTTQYFTTVSVPGGDAWNFSGGTAIPVTASSASFNVRVTFKDHTLPSGMYAVTAGVTAFTTTDDLSTGSDAAGTTITVDNLAPADAAWGTITADIGQVALNWSNPADSDFAEVVILRGTATISDAPSEGIIYSVPGTIGASDIVYVGSLETFTDTGVSNGTDYYYKIFSRDTYGNYASGLQTGPYIQYQLMTFVNQSENYGDISPDCSQGCLYANGTQVTLNAIEDKGYPFIDWTGCEIPNGSICTVTIDADKNVTANFDTCQYPVRVIGLNINYYSSLQSAYDAASDGDTIQSQDMSFTENLALDINKTITFTGGFNCDYSAVTGITSLNGNLDVTDGTVIMENYNLQQ